MDGEFKQAQENLEIIYGDPEEVKLKTWKDTVKDIVTKLQPIKRKEKLYAAKDIESELRIRARQEAKPKVDVKKVKKRGLIDCKLEMDFGYEFKKKNIIIDVSVDGEVFKLMSNKGSTEFRMYCGVAKRF